LDKISFKSFVWPLNPESYQEELIREPVYEKTNTGTKFSGMGPQKRVITGKGAFLGINAVTDFKALADLFANAEAGALTHPLFGARTVYFTALTMTQSPRADYVAYSFEFTEADANGAIPE
jgi:hypothetical protein